MEPIIYKPGAYKSPGIYNGAGGIYKGRGVYNDGAGGDFVEIGGRKYPFVKIGNKLWISENLDYIWSGLILGGSGNPTTPYCWYLDNDEITNGFNGRKCGLLYNDYAVSDLILNHYDELNGWRVPSPNDYNYLFNLFGGSSICAPSLKSLDKDWFSNWNGNNSSKLSVMPCAVRYGDGVFGFRNRAYIYTSEWDKHIVMQNDWNEVYIANDAAEVDAMSLRLCKDA